MLTYYGKYQKFNHTVDELIEIMKPYYDNYCFSVDAYGETTMYNSNMVLYFMFKYIDNGCRIPGKMLEENIRVDYNKLRMLIRKDKEFAHDASIIQTLVSEGYVIGELKEGFPAEDIANNDNFLSLLYYFGMVTIGGFYRGKPKFVIPNEVVREQVYTYLLDNYHDNHLYTDMDELSRLEENIRVDYNKLRMLIRKDKEFAHDASIIQTLVSEGYVTGELKEGFPAEDIANNNNFLSLLYYFGMVTIGGTDMGDIKFVIPNEVVREQIFSYLLDTYKENDLAYDSYDIRKKEQNMAYRGDFKPFFQFIADSIYTFASQRDRQKGEAFVHGFTLALTSQCRFYRPISELDNQNGYADVFLRPRCEIYKDMEHSYIIELKYLKSQASKAEVEAAVSQAEAQVCRYAETVNVNDNIGHTTLHKVYVVYRGVEMVACDEVQ